VQVPSCYSEVLADSRTVFLSGTLQAEGEPGVLEATRTARPGGSREPPDRSIESARPHGTTRDSRTHTVLHDTGAYGVVRMRTDILGRLTSPFASTGSRAPRPLRASVQRAFPGNICVRVGLEREGTGAGVLPAECDADRSRVSIASSRSLLNGPGCGWTTDHRPE